MSMNFSTGADLGVLKNLLVQYKQDQISPKEETNMDQDKAIKTKQNQKLQNPDDVLNYLSNTSSVLNLSSVSRLYKEAMESMKSLIGGDFDVEQRKDNFSFEFDELGRLSKIHYKSGDSEYVYNKSDDTLDKVVTDENGGIKEYDRWFIDRTSNPIKKELAVRDISGNLKIKERDENEENTLKETMKTLIGGTFDISKRADNFSFERNAIGEITSITYRSGDTTYVYDVERGKMMKREKTEENGKSNVTVWNVEVTDNGILEKVFDYDIKEQYFNTRFLKKFW